MAVQDLEILLSYYNSKGQLIYPGELPINTKEGVSGVKEAI